MKLYANFLQQIQLQIAGSRNAVSAKSQTRLSDISDCRQMATAIPAETTGKERDARMNHLV